MPEANDIRHESFPHATARGTDKTIRPLLASPFLSQFLIPALLLAIATAAHAGLINGDFETGDFTGWTLFNTAHGHTAVSQVVLFDAAGSGTPSLSAQFQVGKASSSTLPEGAGIEQSVLLGSGTLTISLNIAVSTPIGNSDAGTFELLLNGSVVASHDFGAIDSFQIERANLTYSGTIGAGNYEIAIEMGRTFPYDPRETPFQYLDNITLSGSAVPEPATAAFTMTLALIRSRREWKRGRGNGNGDGDKLRGHDRLCRKAQFLRCR